MESNQMLNQMKDLNKNLERIDRHLEAIAKCLKVSTDEKKEKE